MLTPFARCRVRPGRRTRAARHELQGDSMGTTFRKVTRRTLICGGMSVAAAAPIRAFAVTPFTARCGTHTGSQQNVTIFLARMLQALERDSNGAIKISLFPNSSLGSMGAMAT